VVAGIARVEIGETAPARNGPLKSATTFNAELAELAEVNKIPRVPRVLR